MFQQEHKNLVGTALCHVTAQALYARKIGKRPSHLQDALFPVTFQQKWNHQINYLGALFCHEVGGTAVPLPPTHVPYGIKRKVADCTNNIQLKLLVLFRDVRQKGHQALDAAGA